MSTREFDVIVIGSGPGGEVAAGEASERGLRVALVEARLVGGECAYWACMPSKALLRPAQALAEARRVAGAAEAVHGGPDLLATLRRRDEIIHGLSDSTQLGWLEQRGIALVRGAGRLEGERRVRVGDELIGARLAVILATGSEPAVPPVPGLEEAAPWTNREATTAATLPTSAIILGGGVVGVELAQAYAGLGSRVTLLEAAARLVAAEEAFVSEQLHDALTAAGVQVHLEAHAQRAWREGTGFAVALEGTRHRADALIVAAGRRPATHGLGLERVGLTPGEVVPTDEQLRVPGVPWLYAVGDVNGRALLTHVAKYQARIAVAAIAGEPARARGDGPDAPRVIFTEPQVAAVGLTLARAREQGLDAHAYDVPTSSTAGASFVGHDAPGTSRLVVDEADGVVVGATFTGVDVAEWLTAATILVSTRTPIDRLWDAIPAFPTRSEIWLKLLEARRAQRR